MSVLAQLKTERNSFSGTTFRADCAESDDNKSVWDDGPGTDENVPTIHDQELDPSEQLGIDCVQDISSSNALEKGLLSLFKDMHQVRWMSIPSCQVSKH